MNHLTRNDYAKALRLVSALESACGDLGSLARACLRAASDFVASEFTTLSVCDLRTGHRAVVGLPGERLSAEDVAAFDRHFFEHPLVRHHGFDGGERSHRLSDALSAHDFRRSALYGDYYHRVGPDRVVTVPLFANTRVLVSVVLNRRGLDFSERDRERLELLRPHMAFLYQKTCQADVRATLGEGAPWPTLAPPAAPSPWAAELTARERQVMDWVAAGKRDTDIAALLGISPRTVQKHLEHVYVKLGVETRTAAVMRAQGRIDA